MKLDAVIRWFMPKEERFHELLAKNTANLMRAARLFAEFANTQDFELRRVKLTELKGVEREGDELTRQIFDALNSSFITPFDREDIRSIATDLDDILDYIEGVAQHIVIFELREAPEGLRQFAGILVETVAQSTVGQVTVAVGMGLNLAHAPEGTPYPATALARHGAAVTPREGLDVLDGALSYWLSVWEEGRGFAAVRESWLKDAAGLGEEFTATVNNSEIRGRFESLGEDGAMILALADGSLKSIHSGEVQVRRA